VIDVSENRCGKIVTKIHKITLDKWYKVRYDKSIKSRGDMKMTRNMSWPNITVIDISEGKRYVKENGSWYYCEPGNYKMVNLTASEEQALIAGCC